MTTANESGTGWVVTLWTAWETGTLGWQKEKLKSLLNGDRRGKKPLTISQAPTSNWG